MPGRALQAICRCGFERELYVGTTRRGGRWLHNVIAYNEDESDLLSDTEDRVQMRKLRTIPDPFDVWIDGPLDIETIKRILANPRQDVEHGPYLCPRCKAESLMLHRGGIYD
jgi:hypothetical protein